MADMELNNANVFVCSMNNVSRHLEYFGDADLAEINLLKLIYKYACFAPTYACLTQLDALVSKLQRKSDLICVNKIEAGGMYPEDDSPFGTTLPVTTNTAPTISNNTVAVTDEIPVEYDNSEVVPVIIPTLAYTWALADFQVGFTDADGDSQGADIVIASLPATGLLKYNNVDVVANQIITDPTLLTYWKVTDSPVSEPFNFRVSDNNIDNPAFSAIAIMTITVVAAGNVAPTIGDSFISVDNAVVTVLTLAMFTSGLTPPYSDPDGDSLDAIRVDEISSANQGQFLYFGVPVVAGQVITSAQLTAGNFTHVGASVNTILSDVINFSARDAVTLIWVQ